jgi:membrane protease YdiL (CAAX protease family)
MIFDSVAIILLFGGIAFFTNWVAWKRGFFHLPQVHRLPITWKQVVGVFAIYLSMTFLIAPYLNAHLIGLYNPYPPPVWMSNFIQLLLLSTLVVALLLFCRSHGHHITLKIWKDPALPTRKPILYDFMLGALTWCIGFPAASVVNQVLDFSVELFSGFKSQEQVAVHYLRSALQTPSQFFIALLSILIIAPIVEEFIFRGCLQTYLKRHLGRNAALLLSSLCFALLHFSNSQGVTNISLIPTLFVFGGYLGYLYERQASLFASIGLHMTFNLASALRIIFGGA